MSAPGRLPGAPGDPSAGAHGSATVLAEEGAVLPRRRFSPPDGLRRVGSAALLVWAGFGLLYLFLPIFVIVLFSFNDPRGNFNYIWQGFTLDNWLDPYADPRLFDALRTSLQVAALATVAATALGTLVALALVRHRFRGSRAVDLLLVLPLTTPEVVLGSALLTLFLDAQVTTGFVTIVLAHVMFCLSFVALTVRARIRGFDWSLEDAAMDLGATPARTFRRVTLPLIAPGIVAAALLSVTLSLDDFIITLFNSGSTTTFPLYIWGAAKRRLPPQINVVATMILVAGIALFGLVWMLQRRWIGPALFTAGVLTLGMMFGFLPPAVWAAALIVAVVAEVAWRFAGLSGLLGAAVVVAAAAIRAPLPPAWLVLVLVVVAVLAGAEILDRLRRSRLAAHP